MPRDPLHALVRLRRITVDEARRTLARSLAREQAAEQGLAAAEAAIARETEAARLSSADADVEAFAAWLPVGRRVLRGAEAERDQAAGETAQARAALSLARGAEEAAQTLLDQRAAAQRQDAERRQQAELDEVGLRRKS